MNMKKVNPFPFSDDNKRYHTWNYYLKHQYHEKVFNRGAAGLSTGRLCP